MHYQFETIHPFEDGNGRLGRLLITLLMREWDLMTQPLLYLSEYFERRKPEYMDRLLTVSQHGAWRDWIIFFLTAVSEQSTDAFKTVTKLVDLREDWRRRYQTGRTPAHLLPTVDRLFAQPIISAPRLAENLKLRPEQALRVINRLEQDGILTEITGRKRDRLYAASQIVDLLHPS